MYVCMYSTITKIFLINPYFLWTEIAAAQAGYIRFHCKSHLLTRVSNSPALKNSFQTINQRQDTYLHMPNIRSKEGDG